MLRKRLYPRPTDELLPRLKLAPPAIPKRFGLPSSSQTDRLSAVETDRSYRISERSLNILRSKDTTAVRMREFTPVLQTLQRSPTRGRKRTKITYRTAIAKLTLSNSPYSQRLVPRVT